MEAGVGVYSIKSAIDARTLDGRAITKADTHVMITVKTD